MIKTSFLFLKNMFSALILFFYDGGKKPNLEIVEKPASMELMIQQEIDKKSGQIKKSVQIIRPASKEKVDLFAKLDTHLLYKVASFLEKEDFLSIAATNKNMRRFMENIPQPIHFIDHVKNSFHVPGLEALSYQKLPACLDKAEKSKIFAQMLKMGMPTCFKISSYGAKWLDKAYPQWQAGVQKFQIPVITYDLDLLHQPVASCLMLMHSSLFFSTRPARAPHLAGGTPDSAFRAGQNLSEILPILRKYRIPLNLFFYIFSDSKTPPDEIKILLEEKLVVQALVRNNMPLMQELDLSGLRTLFINMSAFSAVTEPLAPLAHKMPHLRELQIGTSGASVKQNQVKELMAVPLKKLEILSFLDLEHVLDDDAHDVFEDLCRVFPENVRSLFLPKKLLHIQQMTALAKQFNRLSRLQLRPDTANVSLARWVQELGNHKGLRILELFLNSKNLRSKKAIDADQNPIVLPLLFPDFKKLTLNCDGMDPEHQTAVGDEIISTLSAFGMYKEIDQPKQGDVSPSLSKTLTVCYTGPADVSLFVLRLLRFSGSRIKLCMPQKSVVSIKESGLLTESEKKRLNVYEP